jgi:hypothetical protein
MGDQMDQTRFTLVKNTVNISNGQLKRDPETHVVRTRTSRSQNYFQVYLEMKGHVGIFWVTLCVGVCVHMYFTTSDIK